MCAVYVYIMPVEPLLMTKIGFSNNPSFRVKGIEKNVDYKNSRMYEFSSETDARKIENTLKSSFFLRNAWLITRNNGYKEWYSIDIFEEVCSTMKFYQKLNQWGIQFKSYKGIPDPRRDVKSILKEINQSNCIEINVIKKFIKNSLACKRSLTIETKYLYGEPNWLQIHVQRGPLETEEEFKNLAKEFLRETHLEWVFDIKDKNVMRRKYPFIRDIKGYYFRSGRSSGNPWTTKNSGIRFDLNIYKLIDAKVDESMKPSLQLLEELKHMVCSYTI